MIQSHPLYQLRYKAMLAAVEGLEPSTLGAKIPRSIHLRYTAICAPCRTRTDTPFETGS